MTSDPAAAPLVVTMLIDPRCPVHAATGILPVKSLAIPGDLVARSLAALEYTFPVGPLIVPAEPHLRARPRRRPRAGAGSIAAASAVARRAAGGAGPGPAAQRTPAHRRRLVQARSGGSRHEARAAARTAGELERPGTVTVSWNVAGPTTVLLSDARDACPPGRLEPLRRRGDDDVRADRVRRRRRPCRLQAGDGDRARAGRARRDRAVVGRRERPAGRLGDLRRHRRHPGSGRPLHPWRRRRSASSRTASATVVPTAMGCRRSRSSWSSTRAAHTSTTAGGRASTAVTSAAGRRSPPTAAEQRVGRRSARPHPQADLPAFRASKTADPVAPVLRPPLPDEAMIELFPPEPPALDRGRRADRDPAALGDPRCAARRARGSRRGARLRRAAASSRSSGRPRSS